MQLPEDQKGLFRVAQTLKLQRTLDHLSTTGTGGNGGKGGLSEHVKVFCLLSRCGACA